MDNRHIGGQLRSIRESLGFTQEQVAKRLGVTRPVISYYESGKRPIKIHLLRKLSNLYGYEFSYFTNNFISEEESDMPPFLKIDDLSAKDVFTMTEIKKILINLDGIYHLLEQ
jgi:transcriptional regulator with XRE-family HTH domain